MSIVAWCVLCDHGERGKIIHKRILSIAQKSSSSLPLKTEVHRLNVAQQRTKRSLNGSTFKRYSNFCSCCCRLKDAPPREWNLIYSMNWKLSSVVDAKHTKIPIWEKCKYYRKKKKDRFRYNEQKNILRSAVKVSREFSFFFFQFWHRGPSMVAKIFQIPNVEIKSSQINDTSESHLSDESEQKPKPEMLS